MTFKLDQTHIDRLLEAARLAGDVAMEIYAKDFEVYEKSDQSPVTEADQRAEEIIIPILKEIAPDIPVVAEEAYSAGIIPDVTGSEFWLVDPIDGTKQFIRKEDEFTVNIALIGKDKRPIFGIVLAPALQKTYFGGRDFPTQFIDEMGTQRTISVRPKPADGFIAVASKSHRTPEVDDYLSTIKVADLVSAGSSIKFCLVAEGKADIYPRFGPTSEWDTGAGHAVLEGAGGRVITPEGDPFLYAKPNFKNGFFIAHGAD